MSPFDHPVRGGAEEEVVEPRVTRVTHHHEVAPPFRGEAGEDLSGMTRHDFEMDRHPPGIGLTTDLMLELAEVAVLVALLLLDLAHGSRERGELLFHRNDEHLGARERGQIERALQGALRRLRPVHADQNVSEHEALPSSQFSTAGALPASAGSETGGAAGSGGSK